jgi:hypothetical protein
MGYLIFYTITFSSEVYLYFAKPPFYTRNEEGFKWLILGLKLPKFAADTYVHYLFIKVFRFLV